MVSTVHCVESVVGDEMEKWGPLCATKREQRVEALFLENAIDNPILLGRASEPVARLAIVPLLGCVRT